MVEPLWALNTIKKLCSPKKWAKVHQQFLGDATPLRHPIMPNFIEIGQTSLEKEGCQLGLGQFFYFVTDGQKRDYLSRDSQRARGANKKKYEKSRHYLKCAAYQ